MDLERVKPLGDKVLVRRDPMLSQTEGGLWAPEHWGDGVHPYAYQRSRALNESNLKARYRLSGVVVACGPGGYGKTGERVPMQLERGMRVLFLDEGEDVQMDDGHEYVMLREHDCIAEEVDDEQLRRIAQKANRVLKKYYADKEGCEKDTRSLGVVE